MSEFVGSVLVVLGATGTVIAVAIDYLALRRRVVVAALSCGFVVLGFLTAPAGSLGKGVGGVCGVLLALGGIYMQGPVDEDLFDRAVNGVEKRVPYFSTITARVNPITFSRYRAALYRDPSAVKSFEGRPRGDDLWTALVAHLRRFARKK